jgi:hypothetical protein
MPWLIRTILFVSITWSDVVRGVEDFPPIIDRGGHRSGRPSIGAAIDRGGRFTPLRDPECSVATMIPLPDGSGLTRPEEINFLPMDCEARRF